MSLHLETIIELTGQNSVQVADDELNDDSLNELYVKQCLFSIPKDEVTRIQHAVEIMVRFLLTSVYENTCFYELLCSEIASKRTVSTFEVPPKIPYAFNNENLLKVGSYYEKTKNHYPDEFDFICVIAECGVKDYVQMKDVTSAMADVFHKCLQQAVLKPFLAGTCIEFVRYVRLHGPAAKLEFRYKDANGTRKSIFVDISPASKAYIQNKFQFELKDIIRYPEWQTITQATGSFLLLKAFRAGHPKHETKVKVSITETENNYILTEMSEKHKQVYRLLKYILNNDSTEEELRELMRSDENQPSVVCCRVFYPRVVYDFPSYIIKTLMFHHCHDCNSSSKTLAVCVLNVLDDILKLFKAEQKRKLFCFYRLPRPFSVLVETMTGDMIEIADNYDSSLKIKKYLKKIRNDILNNRVTEQISLTSEIVPLVEKHRKKRKDKEKCVRNSTGEGLNCVLFMFLCALGVGLYTILHSSIQVRLCWNGTDYVGYINYTSSVYSNISHLTSLFLSDMHTNVHGKSASGAKAENTFCIEYRNDGIHEQQSQTSLGNVSRIYYCGDRRFCTTDDKLYRIKLGKEVTKEGIGKQLVCSAIGFESRLGSDNPPTDIHTCQNGGRLACFQKERACLNMKRKQFIFGITVLENAVSCDKNQTCFQNFPAEAKYLGCYISKHIKKKDVAIQTEICCCDRYKCADPEKDVDEIRAGYIFGVSVLVSCIAFMSLCWCGCCCLEARLNYWRHIFKMRQRR